MIRNKSRWQRISTGLAVFMLTWPLFAWWNMSKRIVSPEYVFNASLTLVVLACILNGLWRVLVSSFFGSIVGLVVFGMKVNGNGLEDAKASVTGAVMGAVMGFPWHHSPPAEFPDDPPVNHPAETPDAAP